MKKPRTNTCFDKLLSGKPFKLLRIAAYLGEAQTGIWWEASTEEESVSYAKTLQRAFDQYDKENNPSRMMARLKELHVWRKKEGYWDDKRADEAITLVFWLEDRGYIKNDSVNGVIAFFDLDGQTISYDRDPSAPSQIVEIMRHGSGPACTLFLPDAGGVTHLN